MDQIPELQPPTSTPTEWSEVERPLLLQLVRMGWQYLPTSAWYALLSIDSWMQVLEVRPAPHALWVRGLPFLDHLLIDRLDIHPDAVPILAQRVFGHAGFIVWCQLVCHSRLHLLQAGPRRGGVLYGRNEVR